MAKDDPPQNFVGRVVTDPNNPPDTQLLSGWLGDSPQEGHRRLYTDPELTTYIDIPTDAILYTEPIKDVQPAGGVLVWVKRDADLKPGGSASSRAARFLQGQVQQDYASGTSPEKAGLRCVTQAPQCAEVTGFTGQCTKQPDVGGGWPCITTAPFCAEVTGFTGQCTNQPWPNPTQYIGCTHLHCPTNDLTCIPQICNVVATGVPGCGAAQPKEGDAAVSNEGAERQEAPVTSLLGCGYTKTWGLCHTVSQGMDPCGPPNPQAEAQRPITLSPTLFICCNPTRFGPACPPTPNTLCTQNGPECRTHNSPRCPTHQPCCTQDGPHCPTNQPGCTRIGGVCPPTNPQLECTQICTQFGPQCGDTNLPVRCPVTQNPNCVADPGGPVGGAEAFRGDVHITLLTVPIQQCITHPTPATHCFICPPRTFDFNCDLSANAAQFGGAEAAQGVAAVPPPTFGVACTQFNCTQFGPGCPPPTIGIACTQFPPQCPPTRLLGCTRFGPQCPTRNVRCTWLGPQCPPITRVRCTLSPPACRGGFGDEQERAAAQPGAGGLGPIKIQTAMQWQCITHPTPATHCFICNPRTFDFNCDFGGAQAAQFGGGQEAAAVTPHTVNGPHCDTFFHGCTTFGPQCPPNTAATVCTQAGPFCGGHEAAGAGVDAQIAPPPHITLLTVPVWQCQTRPFCAPTPATMCFICPPKSPLPWLCPPRSPLPWQCPRSPLPWQCPPSPLPFCPPFTQPFQCGGGGAVGGFDDAQFGGGGGEQGFGAEAAAAGAAAGPIGPTGFQGCTQFQPNCPHPTIWTLIGPRCPTRMLGCTQFGPQCPTRQVACTRFGPQCPRTIATVCTQVGPQCPPPSPWCTPPITQPFQCGGSAVDACPTRLCGGGGGFAAEAAGPGGGGEPTPATVCFICTQHPHYCPPQEAFGFQQARGVGPQLTDVLCPTVTQLTIRCFVTAPPTESGPECFTQPAQCPPPPPPPPTPGCPTLGCPPTPGFRCPSVFVACTVFEPQCAGGGQGQFFGAQAAQGRGGIGPQLTDVLCPTVTIFTPQCVVNDFTTQQVGCFQTQDCPPPPTPFCPPPTPWPPFCPPPTPACPTRQGHLCPSEIVICTQFGPQCGGGQVFEPPRTPVCPTRQGHLCPSEIVICTQFGPQCPGGGQVFDAGRFAIAQQPTPATHCFVCPPWQFTRLPNCARF